MFILSLNDHCLPYLSRFFLHTDLNDIAGVRKKTQTNTGNDML